jgi:hypothetical protein
MTIISTAVNSPKNAADEYFNGPRPKFSDCDFPDDPCSADWRGCLEAETSLPLLPTTPSSHPHLSPSHLQ